MTVVVVGAGLAGLSAAHRLIKFGNHQVIIIEATSRAGGRIHSEYRQDGSRLDLGAQWLHGEQHNPVYKWLVDEDLIEGPEDEESEFEGLFRSQDGREPDSETVAKVLELLMDAKSDLYRTSSMLDPKAKPVDIFRELLKFETRDGQLKTSDQNLVRAVSNWFELYEMIDNSCEKLSLLSLRAYSDWKDYDDGKMMRLKGGWQAVVDKLVTLIGGQKLILSSPVEHIEHSNEGVVVRHKNGFIKCDHVIVTFSVGVWRSFSRDFFKPSLDDQLSARLDNVGFGTVNKIFLEFERPYLQEEKGLKLLWLEQADVMQNLPHWTRYISGFDTVSSAPNFLMGWIGGDGAPEVELLSEREIGETCLQIFKSFAPDKQVPKLISVSMSRWSSNASVGGAYSYPKVSNGKHEISSWNPILAVDSIKQRTIPRVLFAGEATSKDMYATAHGAIVSGWREADRLLALYSANKN